MSFAEFTFLLVGAIIVTFLLMMLGEKIMRDLISTSNPILQLLGSLVFTYGVLLFSIAIFQLHFQIVYFLAAGGIIIFNRYWMGHFSQEEPELKALSIQEKLSD